jgi:hypothetical protein
VCPENRFERGDKKGYTNPWLGPPTDLLEVASAAPKKKVQIENTSTNNPQEKRQALRTHQI